MSKRNKVLGLLGLSCALIVTAVLIVGSRRASSQDGASEAGNSVWRINSKAEALNSADETQIRDLTNEIFKSFELDQVPAALTDGLRERLVRAEVNYRSGRGNAVSEFGIVRMTNMLGDKLGAPAYFKTNVFEVRRLEMAFMPFLSKLIGKKPAGHISGPKARKSSVNATMSPLEAFTIAGLLIQQKRFNPTYQVTQEEFLAKHAAKAKDKDKARGPDKAFNLDMTRRKEVEQTFERGANALSVTDLLKLSHDALDKLGVARTEGGTGQ